MNNSSASVFAEAGPLTCPECNTREGLLIDNFAGGGGASCGIEQAYGRPVDVAINHDPDAILMHAANHPHTLHLAEDVFTVSPRDICAGRPVDLCWLSPDCTHFSKAKGQAPDRPRDRKRRGLAWIAVKWAAQVRPRLICLENVEEFEGWGPLLNGKPDPDQKGKHFLRFVTALRTYGYQVEWKCLTACDYGAPTSRKRFFLIARCDGQPIVWPEPTHGTGRLPYRTAAECIDWSIPTVSIFATPEEAKPYNARRPLAENTLRRIARGVVKFIMEADNPYLLNDEQAAIFIARQFGNSIGHSVENPLATTTANYGGKSQLVTAFLSKYHGLKTTESRCSSPDDQLPTQDTSNRFGLVTANLIAIAHTKREGYVTPADRPLGTITTGNKYAVAASYLTKFKGENIGQDMRKPVQTITAGGQHFAEVRALLIKYYGQGEGQSLNDPMHTATTRDRFGLVTIKGELYCIEDIGLRMLSPRELATAQGFPLDYELTGSKKVQVAKIGNSVPPQLSAAVVRANMRTSAERACPNASPESSLVGTQPAVSA
jgi:DNA (cytosine-5)-methyltransferase 1